jgi:predicted TIM-barrel fold metal-dependent hydrolase
MLSRRELFKAAGAAGITALLDRSAPLRATASQPSTPINFDVPPGTCDCHTHVFDPKRFAYVPGRDYTPEAATISEMRLLHRALHTDRVVISQAEPLYGTDNSCILDAIRQLGPGARGIAAIGDKTSDAALDELHKQGIRGITMNLDTLKPPDPNVARHLLEKAINRIKNRRDWHIEVFARLVLIEALKDQIMASPVPIAFVRFGGAEAALGPGQPGFSNLCDLIKAGRAYVLFSAPYRTSKEAPDFPDVAPLAKAFIAANPERVIWGSDWPHPAFIVGKPAMEITPLLQIDDGRILNMVAVWAPRSAMRKKILVDNPARLYGF